MLSSRTMPHQRVVGRVENTLDVYFKQSEQLLGKLTVKLCSYCGHLLQGTGKNLRISQSG